MATITVHDIPDPVHRALQIRAAKQGCSVEAEIRDILTRAATPEDRTKLGALLVSIAQEAGEMTEAEAKRINQLRDKTPTEPRKLE